MRRSSAPEGAFPHDLHVLGTPPAFVLSQDQTLRVDLARYYTPICVASSCSELGVLHPEDAALVADDWKYESAAL